MSIDDVQVSDSAYRRHLRVSQPHHSLFQIPRKPGSFTVNLVGGDTNWVTNVKNKRALFAQETGHILPV